MTRTKMAALALAAGVTIAAAPALMSWAADSDMQTAQAQTPANPGAQPPSEQPEQGMPGMRGMMGREGMGPMDHHWMREAMNRSPRERCEERLARRAGVAPIRSPS